MSVDQLNADLIGFMSVGFAFASSRRASQVLSAVAIEFVLCLMSRTLAGTASVEGGAILAAGRLPALRIPIA
jgi:hypothetical protein